MQVGLKTCFLLPSETAFPIAKKNYFNLCFRKRTLHIITTNNPHPILYPSDLFVGKCTWKQGIE